MMVWLPALILSVAMLIGATLRTSQTFNTVRPDKPISCEEFQAHLEVYVSGRLAMSILISKKSTKLCWGSND